MKLRIALLALIAVAGVLASVAVAKPPTGNPHDQTGSTTGTTATGTTATTTTTKGHGHANGHSAAGKVLVCHKVGNGKYVLVKVSANSAPAEGKHGDVLATNGTCPGPIQGHTGTGTGEHETTTATTTTAATTTS